MRQAMNNALWLRDAILAQFGTELAAGKHTEYPALRRMWLEAAAEQAEEQALVQAHGDRNSLQEN
jgi:hypothetical protein